MLVQYFLRSGGTLADLATRYSIAAKRHGKYPNLVLLKYNQIDSPFAEAIVKECRGLILDETDNWRVVCLAFTKFFNHGEGHAAPIDWATARVQEKLDGSLCQLYYYDGDWHVATSGTPDAGGNVGVVAEMTFKDLFWRVFRKMGFQILGDATRCYTFELTTPFNRVVVPHMEEKLTLIGVRDLTTLQEDKVKVWEGTYPVVKEFPLGSFDDIVATFPTFDPMSQEGFVVVDDKFNRVKVKHPGYVAIHHLKDGMSTRRLLEIIRAGESSEFLVHCPEWTEEYNKTLAKFNALVLKTEDEFAAIKDMPNATPADKKAFALLATKCAGQSAMFSIRSGRVATVRQFYAGIAINSLMDSLKLRNIEVKE